MTHGAANVSWCTELRGVLQMHTMSCSPRRVDCLRWSS